MYVSKDGIIVVVIDSYYRECVSGILSKDSFYQTIC